MSKWQDEPGLSLQTATADALLRLLARDQRNASESDLIVYMEHPEQSGLPIVDASERAVRSGTKVAVVGLFGLKTVYGKPATSYETVDDLIASITEPKDALIAPEAGESPAECLGRVLEAAIAYAHSQSIPALFAYESSPGRLGVEAVSSPKGSKAAGTIHEAYNWFKTQGEVKEAP